MAVQVTAFMFLHIENLSKTPLYAATSMNFSGKFIGMAEKQGDLDRFNFSLYVFLLALFLYNDRCACGCSCKKYACAADEQCLGDLLAC